MDTTEVTEHASILPLRLKNDQKGRLIDAKSPCWQLAHEEGTKDGNISHHLQNCAAHKTDEVT